MSDGGFRKVAIETNTEIGLISQALILCGEAPTDSLAEDRHGVTVGANLFELVYEDELQSNRWRFAMATRACSRVNDTPLNEWQYSYQIPTNCLLPIGVYPVQPYEIYGDKIYTNATSVTLEQLTKPEITEVPAYFALLLTYALAKNMIKPITESDAGERIMTRRYNEQRARAMYADAQSRPGRPIIRSPFTDVR
jgi:hypothetical protein